MTEAGLKTDAPQEYDALAGCFAASYASMEPYAFHLKGHFALDRLGDAVASHADMFAENSVFLDLGCGMVMAGLDVLDDEHWLALCKTAAALGGHVFLERAPETFKKKHDVFGPDRPEWQVVHRVKAALDPLNIFAPGQLPGRK